MGTIKLKWTRMTWGRFIASSTVPLLLLAVFFVPLLTEDLDLGLPPGESAMVVGVIVLLASLPFIKLFWRDWTKDSVNVLALSGRLDKELAHRETRAYLRKKAMGDADSMSIVLEGKRFGLEIMEKGNWASVLVRPLPPKDIMGLVGFQDTLKEHLEGAIEQETRLKGLGREKVKDGLPIVARRTSRQWALDIGLAVLFSLLLAAIPLLIWHIVTEWPFAITMDRLLPILIASMLTLASPFLVWVVRICVIDMLEDRVELASDHVRVMRGRLVLKRIAFGENVEVDAQLSGGREDGTLVGYKILKGWTNVSFSSEYGYYQEDVERMWPVLESSVWNHHMEMGKNMRKLVRAPQD
jgi:hypothetical protein